MPAAHRAKKPSSLSTSLLRSLDLYAVAAAAAGVSLLALAQSSEAQIIYTPAHKGIGRNGRLPIDLNHDGTIDLVIREIPWGSYPFTGNALQAVAPLGGGFIRGSYIGFADDMAPGSNIGASGFFISHTATMILATSYGGYYYGSWAPKSMKRYLGIRFLINGEIHYGWARLNAGINYYTKQIDAILTGYAYETQPNTLIRAGDRGLITEPEDRSSEEESAEEKSGNVSAAAPVPGQAATLGALAAGANGVPM